LRRLIHSAIEHPRAWLAFFGAVTLLLGAGMMRLELRTDGATLRPPGDEVVALTEMDRLRFQEPRQVILLVTSRPEGDPVASPAGFRFLVSLVTELRALPAVRASSILSLPDLPKPRSEGGVLELATMLDDVPDDAAAFASLVAELRSRRITDGLLLSSDGRVAALYVPLVENRRVLPLIVEIEAWLARHRDDPFALELTGPEVAEATLGRMVLRDLAVFVPVMLAVIVAVLWAVLRSFGYVLVPMAEALAVLVCTLGAMGWAGVPVTLVTTILPVVLMAMSITDEIHLLERVQALVRPPHALALPQAVEHALGELTRPLVAATVTTAVGFASFASASMAPVRQFGVFAAFGIVVAMVLSFLWVPALMTVLPRSWFSV
jgi:predicted RND superfamily exporter protein